VEVVFFASLLLGDSFGQQVDNNTLPAVGQIRDLSLRVAALSRAMPMRVAALSQAMPMMDSALPRRIPGDSRTLRHRQLDDTHISIKYVLRLFLSAVDDAELEGGELSVINSREDEAPAEGGGQRSFAARSSKTLADSIQSLEHVYDPRSALSIH
jgi:hypothetical protein